MRRVLWVASVLVSLLVAGRVFEVVMWNRDARRDPEPGRQVGRWRIHCTGRGSPTVVLESGLGDSLVEWRRVQPGVAEFTRVCSYDRAGYGGSDEGPYPRTSERIAGECGAGLWCGGIGREAAGRVDWGTGGVAWLEGSAGAAGGVIDGWGVGGAGG